MQWTRTHKGGDFHMVKFERLLNWLKMERNALPISTLGPLTRRGGTMVLSFGADESSLAVAVVHSL